MPIFDFKCKSCGATKKDIVFRDEVIKCYCGADMARLFTPTNNFIFPEYMKPENEEFRARHRLWMETEDYKSRRDSGEIRGENESVDDLVRPIKEEEQKVTETLVEAVRRFEYDPAGAIQELDNG